MLQTSYIDVANKCSKQAYYKIYFNILTKALQRTLIITLLLGQKAAQAILYAPLVL